MPNTAEEKKLSILDLQKRIKEGSTVSYIVRKRTSRKTFVSVFVPFDGRIDNITVHVSRALELPRDNKHFIQTQIGNVGYNVGIYLADELAKVIGLPENSIRAEEL
jgi:hypothetical protein